MRSGRPDFEAALLEVADECSPACGTIGVYVGGPKGMNTAVRLAVARLNGQRRAEGAYFELHQEAVEL